MAAPRRYIGRVSMCLESSCGDVVMGPWPRSGPCGVGAVRAAWSC